MGRNIEDVGWKRSTFLRGCQDIFSECLRVGQFVIYIWSWFSHIGDNERRRSPYRTDYARNDSVSRVEVLIYLNARNPLVLQTLWKVLYASIRGPVSANDMMTNTSVGVIRRSASEITSRAKFFIVSGSKLVSKRFSTPNSSSVMREGTYGRSCRFHREIFRRPPVRRPQRGPGVC